MIKFILGKSGTGKTEWINNKIRELISKGENKIIMIVPDQSTFETEKAFLNFLGAKQSKNVLSVGFSTLCRYVFEQTENIPTNVIDDGTRAVMMNLALEQLTEKLTLLKSSNSRSIADVLLTTLSDCKKNAVTTDMLRKSAETLKDETLKTKLNETALVLDTFEALVSQSYIDPLDNLSRLYNILSENFIFNGYTLFVDSFSGFNAEQIKVLRLLLSGCRDSYISLTLDPLSDGQEDVFATSRDTYKALKNIAKQDMLEIKPPVKLTENKRFSSTELSMLESGVFRRDYSASGTSPTSITVYAADNTYDECEFTAKMIKKLVYEEDYLYSDITIICHDVKPYKGILDTVLEKYEIPFFMDSYDDISVKPVVRLVSSLFKMILNDFERDDVLSLLKTGLTNNSSDDISVFENYVFVWNVNRSAFKKEFTQNPRGFSEKMNESDILNLKTAERVRSSVIDPVLQFKTEIKDKNGRQITELLYNLLCDLGAPEALAAMCDELENLSEKDLGIQQIRVWNFFTDVLDKMVATVGDMYLSAKRYYKLLSIQTDAIILSDIPQTLDSVTVTTAQRVRLSKQKASFLIGCVDGEFPAVPHSSGIFSDYELKLLELNDLKFSEDFGDTANLETFMAYCCMTSPSEKLFASYPVADLLGEAHAPSVIMTEIQKIFPNITALDSSDFMSPADSMWAKLPTFEEWAKAQSHSDSSLDCLEEYFADDEKYAMKAKAVKRAVNVEPFKIKDPENARLLFGDNLRISASQIEKFNMCRFAYFCNYGLRVRERRRAEIDPMEYGTLVHYILERFFSNYTKDKYADLSDGDIEAFTDKVLEQYLSQYFGGKESKTNSFLYKLEVLKQNVCILLRHTVRELSQSDFSVADCELKIGQDIPAYTIMLSNGLSIAVCGSIDRVDIMDSDGEKYLRVVDYKTGTKQFKLFDILYGLNLQMLLYLHSAETEGTEKYGNIIPAGILYMPSTVPVLSADINLSDDKIQKEIDKKLKMNGLLLDDIKVIKGMERDGAGTYIPVKIKAGAPDSKNSLASLEQFGKIFKKLDSIITSMGEDLYNGEIQASPVKGTHDDCPYCP
ncbi:MAG: PD-(D/E)XK nuclease family protein, partial [Clostridiales bacterium]|nr:PD-(D/E)XK nuclease family protein [Clostridiales bacterium]